MEGKDKIVLNDGTTYPIENGAAENYVQIIFTNRNDLFDAFDKFSEENLESYKIQNSEGLICNTHENKYLEEVRVKRKGTELIGTFCLADIDMLQKQLDAIKADVEGVKEGQEMQDGAIQDLGETVSGIVEGSENL